MIFLGIWPKMVNFASTIGESPLILLCCVSEGGIKNVENDRS